MKIKLILFLLFLFPAVLCGQSGRNQNPPAKAKENYTLSGLRHGVNYFPGIKLPQVQYEAGDTLSFEKYHTTDVIYAWMKKWADKYPELVDLYEVGKALKAVRFFK